MEKELFYQNDADNRINKIAFILPYFGKIPDVFYAWMNSAKSEIVDFYIISDNDMSYDLSNIYFIKMSFEEVKNILQKQFPFKIKLGKPYKLCDYKPVYGKAFDWIVKDYKWWAYGDCDVVYGNIDKYLKGFLNSDFDKIGLCGHFTIIKNNYKMNDLYCIEHNIKEAYMYKEVYRTCHSCAYDEYGGGRYRYGLSYICDHSNIKQVELLDIADLNVFEEHFSCVLNGIKYNDVVFCRNNGSLYMCNINKQIIREVFYAHFQKKNLKLETDKKNFWIVPNKIVDEFETKDLSCLSRNYAKKIKKKIIKTRIKNGGVLWAIIDYFKLHL